MTDTLNPSAWAQAVEAMDTVAADCCCEYDNSPCRACRDTMLRAALPHLLRAVVGGTRWTNGQWMLYKSPDELLAALTDAAGRVHD